MKVIKLTVFIIILVIAFVFLVGEVFMRNIRTAIEALAFKIRGREYILPGPLSEKLRNSPHGQARSQDAPRDSPDPLDELDR